MEDAAIAVKDKKKSKVKVTSDEQGKVWLIVGSDSGFEGPTTVYYNGIHVQLSDIAP